MAENNPSNKRRNITGTYKSPERYPKPAPRKAENSPEPPAKPDPTPTPTPRTEPPTRTAPTSKPAPQKPASDGFDCDNAPTGYFNPVNSTPKKPEPTPEPDDFEVDFEVDFDVDDDVNDAPEQNGSGEKTPFNWKLWFSGDNLKGFLKELGFYSGIVIVSILLTYFIVGAANDVFAFIKDDKSIVVTVPEGSNTKEISKLLDKSGVIEHPFVFRMYCKLKKAEGTFKFGEYALNSNMGYDAVIAKLKKDSAALVTTKLTIPVGATQDDIMQLLNTHEYATMTDLDKAFNSYEYDEFEFTKDLPDRRSRLEGYLPAGEYEFYEGESAVSIVSKMLQRFEETMLTDHNLVSIKATGKSLDYLITVASLVQAECGSTSEYKNVASVLANRLASPTDNYLRLTSTINYVLPKSKSVLTESDKLTDSSYNTYLNPGLPTGPVTTPSAEAFDAVINPISSAYTYFISDGNKVTLSQTIEEHEAALKKSPKGVKGTDTIR